MNIKYLLAGALLVFGYQAVNAQEMHAGFLAGPCHTNTASAPHNVTCTHAVIDIDDTEEECVPYLLVDVTLVGCIDTTDDGPTSWWCTSEGSYMICVQTDDGDCTFGTHTWKCRGAIGCYLGINAGEPTLVDDQQTSGKKTTVTLL